VVYDEDVERFVDFPLVDAEDVFFGNAGLTEDTRNFLDWFDGERNEDESESERRSAGFAAGPPVGGV